MKNIYNKIINNEIDIKYLSPIDLLELAEYLESMKIDLNKTFNDLKRKKSNLLICTFDEEVI